MLNDDCTHNKEKYDDDDNSLNELISKSDKKFDTKLLTQNYKWLWYSIDFKNFNDKFHGFFEISIRLYLWSILLLAIAKFRARAECFVFTL